MRQGRAGRKLYSVPVVVSDHIFSSHVDVAKNSHRDQDTRTVFPCNPKTMGRKARPNTPNTRSVDGPRYGIRPSLAHCKVTKSRKTVSNGCHSAVACAGTSFIYSTSLRRGYSAPLQLP